MACRAVTAPAPSVDTSSVTRATSPAGANARLIDANLLRFIGPPYRHEARLRTSKEETRICDSSRMEEHGN
jgi:hypothetical protein